MLPQLLAPGQVLASPHKLHSPPVAGGEGCRQASGQGRQPENKFRPGAGAGRAKEGGLGLGWGPAYGSWSFKAFPLQEPLFHMVSDFLPGPVLSVEPSVMTEMFCICSIQHHHPNQMWALNTCN